MTITKFTKQFAVATFVFAFGLLMHAQSTQSINNSADSIQLKKLTQKVAFK